MTADRTRRPPAPEEDIRAVLRPVAIATARRSGDRIGLVEELTIPPGTVRADIAVIGGELIGYEIKSAADNLRRLRRQAEGFERIFDRSWVVAAERHVEGADLLPRRWGVMGVDDDPALVRLRVVRHPRLNPSVDPEMLVRLLWRDEVANAIRRHGENPDLRRGRSGMWTQLLRCGDDISIRAVVRDALRQRRLWRGAAGAERLTLSPGVAR